MPIAKQAGTSWAFDEKQVLENIKNNAWWQYDPSDTPTVNVLSPTGEVGHMPFTQENAANLIKSGGRFLNEDEEKKAKIKQEYGTGTNQILAGLAGAARGLTFGLSDPILNETGLADRETLANLKEANPGISMASELASMALGGGIGAAAKGSKAALGLLPGATSKASKMLEGTILNALKPGLASKVTAKAAASAAEGSIYGAQSAISDAYLQNKELAAEELVSTMGIGALAGAALVGAGSVAASTAKKGIINPVKKGTSWISNKITKAQAKLSDIPQESIDIFAKPTKLVSHTGNTLSITPEESMSVAKVLNAKRADKLMETHANDMTNSLETFLDVRKDIIARKKPFVSSLVKDLSKEELEQAKLSAKDTIKSVHDNILVFTTPFEESSVKTARNRLTAISKTAYNQLEKAKSGSEVFKIVDDFKGKYYGISENKVFKEISDLRKAWNNQYTNIKNHLENVEFYGQAADAQKTINAIASKRLSSGIDPLEKFSLDYQGDIVVNKGKIHKFLQKLRGKGEELAEYDIKSMLSNLKDDMDFIKAHAIYDNTPGLAKSIQKAEVAYNNALYSLENADKLSYISDAWNQIKTKSGIFSMNKVGGGLLGGIPGYFVGAAADILKDPKKSIVARATLANMFNKTAAVAETSATLAAAKKATQVDLRTMLSDFIYSPKLKIKPFSIAGLDKAYAENSSMFKELQRSGDNTDSLSGIFGNLDSFAPEVMNSMKQKVKDITDYLVEKMPQQADFTIQDMLHDREQYVPKIEKERWMARYEVANNPAKAVELLKDGRFVGEARETLQRLYPEIYKVMVDNIIEELQKGNKMIPYYNRVLLQRFTGMPVDKSIMYLNKLQPKKENKEPVPGGVPVTKGAISAAKLGKMKSENFLMDNITGLEERGR